MPMNDTQANAAEAAKRAYDAALREKGFAPVTTEILPAPPFDFAEGYHQQYLAKNSSGYCGLRRHRRVLPDRHRRHGVVSCKVVAVWP